MIFKMVLNIVNEISRDERQLRNAELISSSWEDPQHRRVWESVVNRCVPGLWNVGKDWEGSVAYLGTPPVLTAHEWNRGDSEASACQRYKYRWVDSKPWVTVSRSHIIGRDEVSQSKCEEYHRLVPPHRSLRRMNEVKNAVWRLKQALDTTCNSKQTRAELESHVQNTSVWPVVKQTPQLTWDSSLFTFCFILENLGLIGWKKSHV